MTWSWAVGLSAAWLVSVLFSLLRVRMPRPLTRSARRGPRISVIVPARNEARNIERCLGSVLASEYDAFELILVDDRSDDGTADIARSLGQGNADSFQIIQGAPLPDGWMGKPWACHQGAGAASGDLLLFTDADTAHAPDLMGRAVAGLEDDEAAALTVLGHQEMESFWERLVQPQIFFMMLQMFPDTRRPFRKERWRQSVANGQYILVRRDAYDDIGGHEAVKDEVVEDLRLAQILTKAGHTLVLREAREHFATRMYQSLEELIQGWSKNSNIATRQVLGPVLGAILIAAALLLHPVLWVLPSGVLLVALGGGVSAPVLGWAAAAYGAGVLQWGVVSRFAGIPSAYGLLHPLGSVVVWYIVARSTLRGSRVEWKGRRYRARASV